MPRHAQFVPHGVIPAVLLPFHDDLSIDERSFRQHLRDVGGGEGHRGHHHQCPFDRGRRRAASTSSAACSRWPAKRSATGCRSSPGSRPTAASRRPASPVWRRPAARPPCWCFRRRRSGSARPPRWRSHISAHRRGERPAAHRVPVSAGDRPGLSARYAVPARRGGADAARHQGLGRQVPQHEMHIRAAAGAAAAGQRAHHPQRMAVELAGARLQRAAVGQRQRHRRPAGGAVPRRAGATISPRRGGSTTASIRWRGCSTPSRGPTCTTG